MPQAAKFFEQAGANVKLTKLENTGHAMFKGKRLAYSLAEMLLQALGRPYATDEPDQYWAS